MGRVRVVRHLSHFVQESYVVFLLIIFVEEHVRFLKFVALSMFLNSHGKGLAQPIDHILSLQFSRVASSCDRFNGVC